MIVPRWMHSLSRVDFLNSVGLYITQNSLSLVCLRKDLFRISLVANEMRKITAEGNAAANRQALADAMAPLLTKFNPAEDPFYLCLSPDRTLVCEVLLPQVAEESMRQVLDYEIERLLPFRREELYYDYLLMGKKGEFLRLFLFAVPRRTLDGILDVLLSFGIQPAGVDTTSIALSNYLMFCSSKVSGPTVVMAGENGAVEMIGLNLRSGSWKEEAEKIFSHRLSRSDWVQGPAKELFHGLQHESLRYFGFGPVKEVLLSLNGGSMEIEDMTELAEQRLVIPDGKVQPAVIPAIGAALKGLRETTLQVNFRPEAQMMEGSAHRVSRLNGSLLLFFLLGLVIWGASYPIKDEIQLARYERRVEKLSPSVKSILRTEEEVNKLNAEVSMLAEQERLKGEALRLLSELSLIVPESAYLTILRIRDGNVELRGSAENASSLVPLLERSSLLKNVGFSAPTNRGRDNRETFSLKAEVER